MSRRRKPRTDWCPPECLLPPDAELYSLEDDDPVEVPVVAPLEQQKLFEPHEVTHATQT
ncbi:MAG: hypothetical protein HQ582_15850 [Planctomycetes bacterium]|nr:hypothetical protein [Planctomycetota bacterium]